MATWKFYNVPSKGCDNSSLLLSDSEEMLEDMTKLCNTLDVFVNISFAYTTLTFEVKRYIFLSQRLRHKKYIFAISQNNALANY